MSKHCLNCGCEISGEGKNNVFCDECLSKVSPFLKFISMSNIPAIKLYEANFKKLRQSGLSAASLEYIKKCCIRYDEKRGIVIAPDERTSAASGITAAAIGRTVKPSVPTASAKPSPDPAPTAAPTEAVTAPVTPPVTAPAKKQSEFDAADDYDDSDSDDSQKRLTLIIIAAVVTLALFFALFVGGVIPGYTPDTGVTPPAVDNNTTGTGTDSDSDTVTDSDTVDTELPDTDTETETDDGTESVPPETETDSDTVTTPPESDTTGPIETVCTHSYVDATCTAAATCSKCGETKGNALGHDWMDADCTEPKTCDRCGDTDGNALGHTWGAASCTDAKTCSVCGTTDGSALGHTWTGTDCESPQTCSVCGAVADTAAGHTWVEADCEMPKICSVCGLTEGDALGHDWDDATCTQPKTCNICGDTEGDPLGHTTGGALCPACGEYLVAVSQVGTSLTDELGLVVTLSKIETVESGSVTTYYVEYTLVNNTEDSIGEGSVKIFTKDGGVNPSVFYYEAVAPDGVPITRTVTFSVSDSETPLLIEYYSNSSALENASAPHMSGALLWEI